MNLCKKFNFSFLILILILSFCFQTIVFCILNSTITIKGDAYARVNADVRITDFKIKSVSNSVSNYNEFNKNEITMGITLNNNTSSVVYSVEVSNYNSNNIGIYSISGLPTGLSYSISNYTVGSDSLINGIGSKTFELTISGNPGNYDISLDFDFRNIYSITYTGISNSNFPSSVMNGENLDLTFSEPVPFNLVVYIDSVRSKNYTYENGKLYIENITGNVKIEYIEKVIFQNLYEVPDFYNDEYREQVKTLRFVNYVDIPTDALAVYDVSENVDGSVTAWIDRDLNMYVGSDWKIYSRYLMERTFINMTSLEYVFFDNFDGSRTTFYNATFENCTSLMSVDMSMLNFSNVTQSFRVFYNCKNLEYVNLGGFNALPSIQAYEMFYGCSKLKSVDLSKMQLSTTTNVNLFQMFKNSSSLETIDIRNFDFSKVTGYYHMLYNVPNDCEIIVKNQTQKNWLINKFSN